MGYVRRTLFAVGDCSLFLVEAVYWLLPGRFRQRGGAIPGREIWTQMDRLAVQVLPLLSIVLFFVGMILALQLATVLQLLGVVEYVADIVAVSMVREMAPLLTGVVLSGFAGAAIAAELGSMQVSEELSAMDVLALQPSRYLVAPRLMSAAVVGPLITTVAMFVGIAGGLLVSQLLLGIAPAQYISRSVAALSVQDVILGLVKGCAFAVIVSAIACFEGARTHGGAIGVGRATTAAVVKAIVAIIAADLFLTVLFFHLG